PTIPHFKLMSVPENRTGKCMPWGVGSRFVRACLGAGLGLALAVAGIAASAQASPPRIAPLVLHDVQESIDAETLGQVWLDPKADATIEEVAGAQGLARFQALTHEPIFSLGPSAAL